MKTVLFTGATGLLGRYFFKNPPASYKLIGTYNKNSNIKKKDLPQEETKLIVLEKE